MMRMKMNKTCDSAVWQEEDWQGRMANMTSVSILQDTDDAGVWNRFHAEHDDLLVYDSAGQLYRHLHSSHSGGELFEIDLNKNCGYEVVKAIAVLAATAPGHRRAECVQNVDQVNCSNNIALILATSTAVLLLAASILFWRVGTRGSRAKREGLEFRVLNPAED
ncbi:hypothetical protein CYMTET_38479 [Cymbomonas tetramitiformis]|uniref:Uncharacterized protein n=1 Tax=Cymbomonas tetramitiformis TaxID=36881 RepID=A0AAE0CDQ0_9CHLO|nr:hypothetical protein CYMTET_38479 [Cymbomonas tetramitiformis]